MFGILRVQQKKVNVVRPHWVMLRRAAVVAKSSSPRCHWRESAGATAARTLRRLQDFSMMAHPKIRVGMESMDELETRRAQRRSRREFAKVAGLGVIAWAQGVPAQRAWAAVAPAPGAESSARSSRMIEAADLDAQVRLLMEGLPVRLSETQLADLRKDVDDSRKSLAKVRAFEVRSTVEPDFTFRA